MATDADSSTTTKKSGGNGSPTVVLVGPPRAGKTSIFSKVSRGSMFILLQPRNDRIHLPTHPQLALNQTASTIPSLTSSTTSFSLPSSNRSIRLIDVPGHPRLQDEVKAKLRTADGAVFVVDAGVASRQEGVSKIAE
jgi:signal recognition particle receptor subunit beta